MDVLVHDPRAEASDCQKLFNIKLSTLAEMKNLSALIIAVPHQGYRDTTVPIFAKMLNPNGCIIDVKSLLNVDEV